MFAKRAVKPVFRQTIAFQLNSTASRFRHGKIFKKKESDNLEEK
jgi:hypothetical protein